ncbi:MAG: hypothetical protein GY854_07905 [Deltaproteobacteria bacterium]|nr:hypothetical protein [Deltaproteobacteria bacterium]
MVMVEYKGAQIFTATKAKEREDLGNRLTAWIKEHPQIRIKNTSVTQSSDNEFHCITIIVFYDYG